jgi:protein CpxP
MKNAIRHVAAPTLLALAFMTSAAFAQTAAPSAPTSPAPAASSGHKHMKKHMHKREDFIETRINKLHSELKITAAQSSQWDAFAQTMRDSAKTAGDSYRERAQKLATMNADDAMKTYAAMTQMRADNTQKLATSFSALYASLSDSQKKTADVMFRNQREKRREHHMARKHAAPHGSMTAPAPAAK